MPSFDEFPPWFWYGVLVPFGLLWGSFLNVVIYRLPRDMSVVRPGSRCPACGTPIRPWNNVPVLSYLFLRGRASCCQAPISPRYPLVELSGGLLAWAVLRCIVFELPGGAGLGQALGLFGLYLGL
ncbi:MAG TPA: prepilin peptidase, partial [Polyangiaceae bacterium]|nr:prepilin peptidase [Polyangiaceae bacterium]